MTRVYPAYRLLQTPIINGWQHHLSHLPSRVLQEILVKVGNESEATTFSIVCQATRKVHASVFNGYNRNPLARSFSQVMFHLILVTTIIRIVRFLLKPLRQPMIISQIIGGVIIGPTFLGRSKWYVRNIKPETSQFIMNNLGVMGFMFFAFIFAVKMDPGLLKKSGKVHVSTALFGIMVPTVAVFFVALYMRKNMDKELASVSSIGMFAGYLGITTFPVLFNVLKELNLLNSQVGRNACSIALIGDAFGVGTIVAFEAGRQGETGSQNALWYMVSLFCMVVFVLFCVRPAMEWINKKTPQGQPVDRSFVVAVLLGVFVMGFLTDMFGIAIVNGPLWLGLVVPDGPGLGATLVEKSKTIITNFLLPFSFILVGSYTDFYALSATDWSTLEPLFYIVLTGYLTKFFSTWIAAFYWRIPFRDGLTLSLILSLRGEIELILFVHFMDKKILKMPGFTLLVLMTATLTATFTPMISILYDPTRPYIVNQRRNIQHKPPDKDLRIVLCIVDTESTDGLIHLLDVSNPIPETPISVYALRLVELEGRSNPLFINHSKQEVPSIYQWTHTINALERYQQLKREFVKLQFFTAVAPKRTMFQDICELALEQEASLIILPFKTRSFYYRRVRRTVNSQVLNNAPCSVAILVDKGGGGGLLETVKIGSSSSSNNSMVRARYRVIVLFMGGADSREALVYADRMVANLEHVYLTVIRFLSHNNVGDIEMEKKLDDGIVTWFWVKNEMNRSVVYKEVVVKNGEETIEAIQSVNDINAIDLLIVGRKHGINPVLLTGLSEWSESDELGIIGDFVSSQDFSRTTSVLVVQQQVLRG